MITTKSFSAETRGMNLHVDVPFHEHILWDRAIIGHVVEKVSDAIAEEMLKRFKGKLVKKAMQSPDLIRACKLEALIQAEKLVNSQSEL